MQWLSDMLRGVIEAIQNFFGSISELVKDIFYWFFNLFMDVVDTLLQGVVSLLEPVDISQYMSGFPSEAAWVLGQVGVPQALGMIGTSLIVRLTLQLIPFTRLGS